MLFVLAAVFAATMLLVVATHRFLNRRRLASADLVRDRLSPLAAAPVNVVPILKDMRASQIEFLNRALSGKSITGAIARQLERAGSSQTVGAFVLTSILLAFLGWFLGSRFAAAIGVAVGLLGAATPLSYLRWQEGKRLKKFETQLPESIDMLVNAMKAGYSLPAAIKFIGDEVPAPLGPIFARFYDEQRLGVGVRTALENMRQRMDTLDMRMFITSLLIQRETGGNLAEIMTNLSTLMRDRVGIRGQIDTLTAEPKLSAVVLTVLPVFLFFMFNALNRDYMQPLYTTSVGRFILLYGMISTAVGYILLRRIGAIDI
jgi:tight adherence protein B